MSIRIRRAPDGVLVAVCGAKTKRMSSDIYLDDEVHYALSQKYWRDYDSIQIIDEEDIARAAAQEEQEE